MAVAFVKAHTVVSEKTLDTSASVTVDTGGIAAGNLIVLAMVFDNAGTTLKPVISSITKMSGETNSWALVGAARSTSTSIGAFASGEVWAIKTTVAWTAGTYTITLDTAVTQKAAAFLEFSGAEATLRSTVGTAYSTTTTAASATTTGTTPVIGDLAIGFTFGSNVAAAQAGDTDTTGGSWSAVTGIGSTGGGGTVNNFGIVQRKILTGANHQTFNNSALMTAGNGSIVAILRAIPEPAITQAAFRLYADGTETGSTALAAQDTAATADLTSGDVNLGVRVRLQETAGSPSLAATDDYQLQWEKNASGTWTDVIGAAGALSDSYTPTSNGLSTVHSTMPRRGQTFLGGGGRLTRVGFKVSKAGTPDGNLTAQLFAIATGTFGTDATPSGTTPLATSTTVKSCNADFTTTPTWTYFDFDGTYTLTNGTAYAIVISTTATTGAGNDNRIDYLNTGPTHAGNGVQYSTSWLGFASADYLFEVYTAGSTAIGYDSTNLTDAAATTNRLGAGSGSFVAGKVSEDGLVDNLSWSASNHTELLYSVTLVAADLADGDTLKFRVLRNGATTGLTYTQTPTINVTVGAGLTPVQIDRPTTWNVAGQPTITRATSWDVLTPVTVTRVASWDTVTPVVLTRAASWNVKAAPTITRPTTWRVGFAVAIARVASWDVTSAHTITRPTTWDVLTPVTRTRDTTWNVAAPTVPTVPVTITRPTSWDVLTPATITRATTWDVRTPVTLTRAATWDALAAVAVTRVGSWRVGQAVALTRAATWDATKSVAITRTTSWDVVTPVALTRIASWDTRAALTTTRTTTWDVLTPVTLTRATTWHVKATLTPITRTTTWNVAAPSLGVVNITRATTWDTRQTVTGIRPTTWDVLTPVATQTRATSWDVLLAVTRTRATTWRTRAPQAITRVVTWDTLAAVTYTRTATWDTTARTTITRATLWDTTTAITRTRATTWRVIAPPITITRTTTWQAKAATTITRQGRWDTLRTLTTPVTRTTSWAVLLEVAGPTRTTTWDVLRTITTTRVVTWDVAGPPPPTFEDLDNVSRVELEHVMAETGTPLTAAEVEAITDELGDREWQNINSYDPHQDLPVAARGYRLTHPAGVPMLTR